MTSERKWSDGTFRHLRRGAYDQAAYHATRGHPDLMRMYYEGKYGGGDEGEPAPESSSAGSSSPVDPAPRSRRVQINGAPLTDNAWTIVQQLESLSGETLPDGHYWYDAICGAFGVWGEGTWLFLPPQLGLGGPLPAHCSGPATGVFINGRDAHPFDLQRLAPVTGPIQPGFYFLDAMGNMGFVGYPPLINLRSALGL